MSLTNYNSFPAKVLAIHRMEEKLISYFGGLYVRFVGFKNRILGRPYDKTAQKNIRTTTRGLRFLHGRVERKANHYPKRRSYQVPLGQSAPYPVTQVLRKYY